jgi:hypothetical protein
VHNSDDLIIVPRIEHEPITGTNVMVAHAASGKEALVVLAGAARLAA